MVARVGRRDPYWDDGKGARRRNRRVRFEGAVALVLAIAACGLTAAMWRARSCPSSASRSDAARLARCRADAAVLACPDPSAPGASAHLVRDHTAKIDRAPPSADLCCGRVASGVATPWDPCATRQRDLARRRDSRVSQSSGSRSCRDVTGSGRASSSRRCSSASGLIAPTLARAAATRQPRPVGEHATGLAERQPQRQQQPVPGGRHRPVPRSPSRAQGRQPLDPHQLRLHGRRAQGVRLPRDLERHERRGQDRASRAAAPSRRCARACRRRRAPRSRPTPSRRTGCRWRAPRSTRARRAA